MSYLVFGLGLLLSVCGSAAVYFGYGIVEVERGWSSVIAGATALSCGVVTIALGFILRSLAKLQAFLEAEKGIKPLLKELALGRATNSPRAPDEQFFGVEPLTGSSDLAPATPAGPFAPTPAPPLAETVAEALPPPVEQLDVHRGRARIFAPRPRESARDGVNVSRASIDDVRRLVAAKIKERRPPEPQSVSGQNRGPDAGGESQSAPESVYASGAEPRHPSDETAWLGSDPAGAPESGEPQSHPVWGGKASVEAAGAAETETASRAAPFLAPRLAEEDVAFLAGSRPAAREAEGEISETARFASEAQALRTQGGLETGPGEVEAAPSPASPHASEEGLAVIGRTESEGTSYVMYADGSIDAHSDRGVFHFKSMADLKAFMESQG